MIYVSSIFLLQLKVGGFIDPSCVFFGKSTDLVNLVQQSASRGFLVSVANCSGTSQLAFLLKSHSGSLYNHPRFSSSRGRFSSCQSNLLLLCENPTDYLKCPSCQGVHKISAKDKEQSDYLKDHSCQGGCIRAFLQRRGINL